MSIKAIFFDIDGTLVPFGDRGIPAEVREAIRQVRADGVKVFIATGRHPEWIDNLGDTEFDGYVTTNGALVLLADKRTLIHIRPIEQASISRLISFAPESDLAFSVLPAAGGIFITREIPEVTAACRLLNLPSTPVRPISEAGGKEIVQLMAFGTEEDRSRVGLFKEILPDCEPTSWNPLFCDIVPKGSDKGEGVAKMLEYFGLRKEDAVAFGDGDNDIPMLRLCGTGVAMGNAPQQVKEAADYVTTDVREHGVVHALQHLGLLSRG